MAYCRFGFLNISQSHICILYITYPMLSVEMLAGQFAMCKYHIYKYILLDAWPTIPLCSVYSCTRTVYILGIELVTRYYLLRPHRQKPRSPPEQRWVDQLNIIEKFKFSVCRKKSSGGQQAAVAVAVVAVKLRKKSQLN